MKLIEENFVFSIKDLLRSDYNQIITSDKSQFSIKQHKYLSLELSENVIITYIKRKEEFFFFIDTHWDKINPDYNLSIIDGDSYQTIRETPIYKKLIYIRNGNDEPSFSTQFDFDDDLNKIISSLLIRPFKSSFFNWYYIYNSEIDKICNADDLFLKINTKVKNIKINSNRNFKLTQRFFCAER